MEKNEEFASKIEELFFTQNTSKEIKKIKSKHKRDRAILDPIELFTLKGEKELKTALLELDVEKLKDVVAQFKFDSSRLVMKWKDKDRIIEHIIKSSQTRAQKGDAFRNV